MPTPIHQAEGSPGRSRSISTSVWVNPARRRSRPGAFREMRGELVDLARPVLEARRGTSDPATLQVRKRARRPRAASPRFPDRRRGRTRRVPSPPPRDRLQIRSGSRDASGQGSVLEPAGPHERHAVGDGQIRSTVARAAIRRLRNLRRWSRFGVTIQPRVRPRKLQHQRDALPLVEACRRTPRARPREARWASSAELRALGRPTSSRINDSR
jgi:hypothetical protein